MSKYVVVSYDAVTTQSFWDFALAETRNDALEQITKARPTITPLDAVLADDFRQLADSLEEATEENIQNDLRELNPDAFEAPNFEEMAEAYDVWNFSDRQTQKDMIAPGHPRRLRAGPKTFDAITHQLNHPNVLVTWDDWQIRWVYTMQNVWVGATDPTCRHLQQKFVSARSRPVNSNQLELF